MRPFVALLLLGSALIWPAPPANKPVTETYRLHVSWYESDIIPCCEVPAPLDEIDSIETVVRPREWFETTYRSGNRHMSLSGRLTPLPRGEFQLDIEWSQVVKVPGERWPVLTVKRVSTAISGLQAGIESDLARLASSSPESRSETETILRRKESVVAVTVSPGGFSR